MVKIGGRATPESQRDKVRLHLHHPTKVIDLPYTRIRGEFRSSPLRRRVLQHYPDLTSHDDLAFVPFEKIAGKRHEGMVGPKQPCAALKATKEAPTTTELMKCFEGLQASLTSLTGQVDHLTSQNTVILGENVELRRDNQVLMARHHRALALRAHVANQGVLHIIASKVATLNRDTPASTYFEKISEGLNTPSADAQTVLARPDVAKHITIRNCERLAESFSIDVRNSECHLELNSVNHLATLLEVDYEQVGVAEQYSETGEPSSTRALRMYIAIRGKEAINIDLAQIRLHPTIYPALNHDHLQKYNLV